MNLIKNIKTYFKNKNDNKVTGKAPEGVCPNCWGKQEWEGEYYKFMKGENENPSTETYNSFIKDVVRKLDKITIVKNTYTCETCKTNFNPKKQYVENYNKIVQNIVRILDVFYTH